MSRPADNDPQPDVDPIWAGRAKALMAAQSLASLTTIVVVGARAINVLQ